MERTMSVEERIKRAEEIYNQRKSSHREENITRVTVNEKKNFKLLKKLFLQIMTCLSIYCIIYLIISNNSIFSEDFRNKAKEILSYDINFQNLYNMGIEKFNSIFEEKREKTEPNKEEPNTKDNKQENNSDENKKENTEIDNQKEKDNNKDNSIENNKQNPEEQNSQKVNTNQENNATSNEENIGGAIEIEKTSNAIVVEKTKNVELSETEQDIQYIKGTTSFIKPVEGVITSKFGYRETATEGIPKNHTGLDIAATIGTKILSATGGTVILASSQGDYRKSSSNTN